jgi:hypothetical protein
MRKIEEKTSTYFTEESAHICFNENNKERGNNLIDQAKQVHILQRKVLIYVLMKTTKREVTI